MWLDIEQNTEEWLNERIGKMTASKFSTIMANEGKAFGNPAIQYARKIALEIVTGKRDERSGYKNQYMADGHELEPVARGLYEDYIFEKEFLSVTNGGFYTEEYKGGIYGDSPDGNVGEEGVLEIKSVIANTQFERLEKGGFDTSYKWQIVGHIWLGQKQWCDFVSYCPEMPESKQLYVHRIERNDEVEDMINRLKYRTNEFWENEVLPRVELLEKTN